MPQPNSIPNPVLATIRELLRFKDTTTISEIASVSGISRRDVLSVLNRNGHMVKRYRETGKITAVDPRETLQGQLWASGAYFRTSQGNYGAVQTLEFEKHEEVRKAIQEQQWWGGFGDSYKAVCVVDTPEHRAALVVDGCVALADLKPPLDDRLWKE